MRRPARLTSRNWYVAILLFVLLAAPLHAKVGRVLLRGSVITWGQYKSVQGIIGTTAPDELAGEDSPLSLPKSLKDFPVSGASTALHYCQLPGHSLFSPDGTKLVASELQRLRQTLDVVNKMDLLTIVVLFDPDTGSRLSSQKAYTTAALNLMRELDKDFWFVLCVTDQCDAASWKQGNTPLDGVQLCRSVAEGVRKSYPEQLVGGGGGGDPKINFELVGRNSPVNALIGRVKKLGDLDPRGRFISKLPMIEVLNGRGISKTSLRLAVDRVAANPSYGFVVQFQTAPAAERPYAHATFLRALTQAVDESQKENNIGSPPDPHDTTSLQPGEAQQGFVSLFNGKDLTGWLQLTDSGNFVVRNSVIRVTRGTGGWLRSWHEYKNFVFRGQYKIAENGNSGFYIRAPLVGRQSRIGFEFQIRGQSPDAPIKRDSTGSIYDVRPPQGNFIKPGQWNDVEITCTGTAVKIVWNGKIAHDFRYEDYPFMKHRAVRGYIGLQDHHNLVEFRNLRIKRLD